MLMARHFNTARRIDFILKWFPKLRRKVEHIGLKYHEIQENWDYDHNYNGERWLVQSLAGQDRLKTVFDVGANHGDWTAMILEANPEVKVHCFEICPPTFEKLAAHFSAKNEKNCNVILNAFGLSDSESEIKVNYLPEGDSGSTIIEVASPHRVKIIDAKVMRGQDYCTKNNIHSIDLLKIDVEGAEHLVLRGFEDMLTPAKVPVVQFEYGMGNILTKYLLRDFHAFFESRGYKVGKLFPTSVRFREYRLEDENFRGPNYVAASPEIAGLLKAKG